MKPFLLSFEFNDGLTELSIHGDRAGLKKLSATLLQLIKNIGDDDSANMELSTPENGGRELSAENQGGNVFNTVTIYCWKNAK